MQRLLLSALSAGLLTVACGAGDPNIVSPSGASAAASPTEPGSVSVVKFYTIGGVVSSASKPTTTVADADISVTYNNGFTVKELTSVDGTFSMAVLPGVMTFTVSKKGFEPWSERISVYGSNAMLRPMLTPMK
jgi:hypothetical protein